MAKLEIRSVPLFSQNEYIDKATALSPNILIEVDGCDGITICKNAIQAYKDYIDALPFADVRPVVNGEWLMVGDYPCSVCGETVLYEYDVRSLKYCPNCGAYMVNSFED